MTILEIKLAVIAVLLAISSGVGLYVRHLQGNIVKLNNEVFVLQSAINDQNKSIDKMKKDGDAREQKLIVLQSEAKIKSSVQMKKATVIYKSVPSVPGNDCLSALELVK